MMTSMIASLLLSVAKMTSSKRNGKDNAMANGHPTMPPMANHVIPCVVFKPPLQFMKAAMPNIVVYMAKLDGRKEAEAMNIPGLKIMDIMKNKAIRGLRVLLITLNSRVWLMAQMKASI